MSKEIAENTRTPEEQLKHVESIATEVLRGEEARKILNSCFDQTKKTFIDFLGIDPSLLPEKLDFENVQVLDPEFEKEFTKCARPQIEPLVEKRLSESDNK